MNPIVLSLEGQVAIVTGASRGIGKAIALALADAGAHVVCASRSIDDLEKTASEIKAKGSRTLIVQTDTTKKQDIDNMVNKTVDEFGTIDILVNNAGRDLAQTFLALREDGWDKMFNTNVKGYYLCAQAVGPIMKERKKGNIINMSSMNAFLVDPYDGPYGASKAAVVQLTKALAGELAHHGIRVNCVAPGVVPTALTHLLWDDPESKTALEQQIPMRRLSTPEEQAAVVIFLASDAASYITGATILADGGITLSGFDLNIVAKIAAKYDFYL